MLIIEQTCPSPIGELLLLAAGPQLCGVYLPDHRHPPRRRGRPGYSPVLAETARQLGEYFAGSRQAFTLPLRFEGTDFQQRVWGALLKIPFGGTCSYAQLAAGIGSNKAVRAVGAANGKNPLSIVVPCHRVVGSTGALTGYAGGLEAKRYLLEHERCGQSSPLSMAPITPNATAKAAPLASTS